MCAKPTKTAAKKGAKQALDKSASGEKQALKKSANDVKQTIAKKAAAKTPAKGSAKEAAKVVVTKSMNPVLLSGGNPQIPKGDGDGPVQAYISALPGWKHDLARRIDALIDQTVPGVQKAVKWNSPMYGADGLGRFLSMHAFKNYLKIAFFRGALLKPVPPGDSQSKEVRYLDIHEKDSLDEAQFVAWVKQASQLPGETL